jgi:uncharacterized HAD superfamily protein
MFILVDFDHTVANSFWRDSMIGTVPWDEYHEQSKYDKPFWNVVQLINSLWYQGHTIIGVTGRTEKHRKLTNDWLLEYDINIDEILMRPDDLFLKNAEMKVKLVEDRFKKDYKSIGFLIEDNEDACLAFQKLGITTLQIRNINEAVNGTNNRTRDGSENR